MIPLAAANFIVWLCKPRASGDDPAHDDAQDRREP